MNCPAQWLADQEAATTIPECPAPADIPEGASLPAEGDTMARGVAARLAGLHTQRRDRRGKS